MVNRHLEWIKTSLGRSLNYKQKNNNDKRYSTALVRALPPSKCGERYVTESSAWWKRSQGSSDKGRGPSIDNSNEFVWLIQFIIYMLSRTLWISLKNKSKKLPDIESTSFWHPFPVAVSWQTFMVLCSSLPQVLSTVFPAEIKGRLCSAKINWQNSLP